MSDKTMLNKSITIGRLTLKNRLVMAPMATSKSKDGVASEKLFSYYDQKTAGGYLGLVITEHCYVNVQGKADPGQLSAAGDCDLAAFAKLADTAHQNGVPVIAQISHAGSSANSECTGRPVVSCSAVVNPGGYGKKDTLPNEMTRNEILRTVNDFADAAARVRKAGFDGVEIHSAHGYLLNQFFSPLTNKRTDEYAGATIEGRLRLHCQIVEAVRRAVGPDFVVALRLGACDYMEGGTTVCDAVAAAKLLCAQGIDLLDISGGLCGYVNPERKGQGYFAEISEAVKRAVATPVLLTGGITDGEAAEALLQSGAADLIGVGRAMLKDSDWARKAL